MTELLLRDDAYLPSSCAARCRRRCDAARHPPRPHGVLSDRRRPAGRHRRAAPGRRERRSRSSTRSRATARTRSSTCRRPAAPLPAPGAEVTAEIDWERRHRLMRMHTCLHLLCAVVPGDVTGGQVGDGKGRLDFDVPGPSLDKEPIAAELNALIAGGSSGAAALDHRRGAGGQPGAGAHHVGQAADRRRAGCGCWRSTGVDLQPCGGTHVARTGEIGPVEVGKIENKGQQNRRVNLAFAEHVTARMPMPMPIPRRSSPPHGSPTHLDRPDLSRSSTAPTTCPVQGRDARAEYDARHIPARSSSTSTRSPTPAPACRTCCRRPRSSPRAIGASCGIGDGDRIVVYDAHGLPRARRASGGCSASSATTTSRCSMAACRNGWPRAGRSTTAVPPAARAPVHRPLRPALVRDKAAMLANLGTAARAGGRRARRRPLRRHASRSPGPAGAAATSPAAATCPSPTLLDPASRHLLPAERIAAPFRRRRRRPRPAGRRRAAAPASPPACSPSACI